jgi:transcriptional regulator with XRE-family HTH domain
VIVVARWTGQEASALRQALRMTIRDFADHLGVAERTVAKWEAGGLAMVPVPVMQAALDTVLTRAPDEPRADSGCSLPHSGTLLRLPGALKRWAPPGSRPPPRCLDALIPRQFGGCRRSLWSM